MQDVQKHLTLAAVVGTLAIAGSLTSAYNLRQHPNERQLRFASSVGMVALLAGATTLVRKREEETTGEGQSEVASPHSFTSKPLLEVIASQQKHPHLLVINKTGGGKSVLAQWMASKSEGRTFAIAPHLDRTKEEWSACEAVFGAGRNYGDTEVDTATSYDELIAGKYRSPSVASVLATLLSEMNRRYNSAIAFEKHPLDTWIVDEAPSVAAELGKSFAELLAPILMEARKINIRLILLTQSDRVAELKFQGRGQLRNQFTYIRLRDAAKADSKFKTQVKKAKVLGDKYWCLVEDSISLIPTFEQLTSDIKDASKPHRFVAEFPAPPLDFKAVVELGSGTAIELGQIADVLSTRPELKGYSTRAKLFVNDSKWITSNRSTIVSVLNNACTLRGLPLCS
jgi:hypothetical protein